MSSEPKEFAVITELGSFGDVLFEHGEVVALNEYGQETPCVKNPPFGRNPSKWVSGYRTFPTRAEADAFAADLLAGGVA